MTDPAIIRVLDSFPLPVGIGREKAAQVLVNYWPAISEHFAQLLLDENPDRDADFSAGVDWAAATIRQAGAKEEPPTRCMCGDESGIPHHHPTWKDPSPRVLPTRPIAEES